MSSLPVDTSAVPSGSPHEASTEDSARVDAMPYEPSRPCAACRTLVDPLRARVVLASERGFHYLCGEECATRFRNTEPSRGVPVLKPGAVVPLGDRGEELAQELPVAARSDAPAVGLAAPYIPWLLPPLCALAFWPDPLLRMLCALGAGLSLINVLAVARYQREEVGPAGLALSGVGGFLLLGAGLLLDDPWLLSAAGVGVLLAWAREALSLRAVAPVDRLLLELGERVPQRTRISMSSADDAEPLAARRSATEQVRAGEEVLVEAGEIVPVDGVVAQGEATVVPHPSAKLTLLRRAGDALLAGARVNEGSLRVTATRVGNARALFRPRSFGQDLGPGSASVVRAVGHARAPIAIVLYGTMIAALALAFGSSPVRACAALGTALLGLPLLALVRGVRLCYVSASALGASRGIVFRDASTLERAGRIGAVALSTDHTITTGTCTLVEVSVLGPESNARELTALAAGAEAEVEDHPIARAILGYAAERGIAPAPLRRVGYERGRGLTALLEGGGALVLGNRQALLNAGVSVAVADREAQRAEAMGRTVVFLAVGGRVRALFILEDPVRPEARAAVQKLVDLDVEVVLIGGNHRTTIEALARPLDITHIKAELTADERAQEVLRLRDTGLAVAVVGTAPSDELALAAGDVALTLDAAGGVHEGDIAVGSDDLRDAADALVLSQRTRRNVQSALYVAACGGVVLSGTAALDLAPPLPILALALVIDAWVLKSPARLLRRRQRSFGTTRSGVGLLRRA